MEVHATPPLNTIPSVQRPRVVTDYKQPSEITEQEQQQIQQLTARDRVVLSHEAAHIAAGGSIIRGSANFSFQRGPNGVQYAVGGEVNIDTSKVEGDPQATLQKAIQIQAAALAPVQSSSQDRSIAAQAAQLAVEARAEITQQRNFDNREQQISLSTAASTPRQQAGELLEVLV